MDLTPGFWADKRVLLTGHTGFKGSWLALWLESLGARVTGFALRPDTDPSLFAALEPWSQIESLIGDVRSPEAVAAAVSNASPDIVIHMAAQAIVRAAYEDPGYALATNVLGTAHLLAAVAKEPSVKAVLVVTSDKVYSQEAGLSRPFVESDPLGGVDPYSASKACQELVASAFSASYIDAAVTHLGTARAGNVIGGGDWARDRLLPDLVRANSADRPLVLRCPEATRPWQHVLDCLSGYLAYARALFEDADPPIALNFGPVEEPAVPVVAIVRALADLMKGSVHWTVSSEPAWPEMPALELDSSAARRYLGWQPKLDLDDALSWTAEWYVAQAAGHDMRTYTRAQIVRYEELLG